jgi:dipeptidyl aminopeptidase/acylaminoacyl peptidase
MRVKRLWVWVLLYASAVAQPGGSDAIAAAIERDGCTSLQASKVKVCRYNYAVDNRPVEAISFQPPGEGPFPGALLIPGHERTAKGQIALGIRLASEGIAAVSVTEPGYGGSEGPGDFVGPKTIKVLTEGYRKFQKEAFVDSRRMGIYGFSQGGMAASLLVLEIDDVKAAVFGAGVYDLMKLHDEVTPKVRATMIAETEMTAKARLRSSIHRMDRLRCPVLILHGDADKTVPVSQAIALRERLTALGKDFEIKIFPGREHGIGPEAGDMTVEFLKRRLK